MSGWLSGTRLEHVQYICKDIFCQHLWGVIQLEGVCVPFGHLVGSCTFSEICICIGYILPTIMGCYSVWRVSVCPSGTWLGHVHFLRYWFVLNIFCQQMWGSNPWPHWGKVAHAARVFGRPAGRPAGRPRLTARMARLTARTARLTARTARLTARTAETATAGFGRGT